MKFYPSDRNILLLQVYDNALRATEAYMTTDVVFCNHPISVQTKLSDEVETPFDDYHRLFKLLGSTGENDILRLSCFVFQILTPSIYFTINSAK